MKNNFNMLYSITYLLYSGRARAYLIKNNIPFEKHPTGHEAFKAEVLPPKVMSPSVKVLAG
tara:strand:- start:224 stop:406 length:183 start_codon:yes stop_codon:yes gene_type:complete